ncbi:E3 ubiquitin-protein ligase mind-bomb-like isoform X2 [Thrips palmi]|uniref:E3 ubiquitin-protein ligase mind-bomb-like isoform X2 n=1 Tax=Thrips palmi TaxID=161013 RepID=A0A6P8YDE8_THRPL|nr:E3 ubiquitin-protein ligase mind-bomb-like isoform X2 [Thrips palmi]
MQTLEALLEKKIPDDYMKNYKKTIHSKLQNSPDTVRSPMHPATSISTLPQSEYVIVDTKNGKRILSIPKQMAGTKTTFVIDGKIASISQPSNSSVTSSKSILLSDPHLGQNRSNLVTAASLTCDTVTTPSISTPLQVPSSNSFILSVPTPTGASRSMQTVIGSSALSFNHKVPSDRLVLPLNSPVTFEGKLSSMDSPADSVASSQSRFQITANSDSIVLPLNSPIKSSNIRRQNNSEICTIPNTTSLFIMVPNDRNLATSLDEAGEAISSSNILKRKAAVLKNDFPSLKKRCPELLKSSSDTVEACEKGGVQQHRNGQIHTSPDSALNPNEFSAPPSKEDINCLVKNAFLEFRNCLVPDKDGKLPIHLAVENNDLAAVKRQCIVLKARRSSIDIPTSKDESPLQLALYHGHCSIAALLLQHGADASITDQEGNTALHLAVMHAEDIFESVFLSRQYTIEFVNNLNDEGFAALHLAAQQDKISAIQWLINHGAEVDLPDGTCGRTALFLAIERKSYRAQKALLASGADMREPTFSGSTPFHLTKADTIAHLTSGQDAVAEFIDSDALLRSPRSSSPSEEN